MAMTIFQIERTSITRLGVPHAFDLLAGPRRVRGPTAGSSG
jgi:hypothetical protein